MEVCLFCAHLADMAVKGEHFEGDVTGESVSALFSVADLPPSLQLHSARLLLRSLYGHQWTVVDLRSPYKAKSGHSELQCRSVFPLLLVDSEKRNEARVSPLCLKLKQYICVHYDTHHPFDTCHFILWLLSQLKTSLSWSIKSGRTATTTSSLNLKLSASNNIFLVWRLWLVWIGWCCYSCTYLSSIVPPWS